MLFDAICALGHNIYNEGQNDIRIKMINISPLRTVIIGITTNTAPPLEEFTGAHSPGLSGWYSDCPRHVAKNGNVINGIDVGQPWVSGDVVRVHLDCTMRRLRLIHERTGRGHTVENVTGPHQLFIFTWMGTEVSLLSD